MRIRASVRAAVHIELGPCGWLALVLAMSCIGCAGSDHGGPPVDVGPCRDGDPNRERWGTSCLCCHATEFGVAGSLAPDAGVSSILVADSVGHVAEMSPDFFDNFFRHEKLSPPLTATITFVNGERRPMHDAAPHGSCNACHGISIALVGAR